MPWPSYQAMDGLAQCGVMHHFKQAQSVETQEDHPLLAALSQ